jgi:hypothetical protein
MSAIDGNGHLFVPLPDGVGFCVGCGHMATAPEAAGRCPDAEGLAADVEAQELLDRLRLAAVN